MLVYQLPAGVPVTAFYYTYGAAWALYCWHIAGLLGLLGSCVMLGLNEWVRRTGGYT